MEPCRVYADVVGLSPEAFEKIKTAMPFTQVDYDGHTLRVDHEGEFLDVDDFLSTVMELMNPDGWAHLDYIDNLDYTLTRYRIENGKMTERIVDVDSVVELQKEGWR